MRLWINGFEFNDPANGVQIHEIEGLDKPPIETSKGKNTGQHGGYIGAQTYGPRPVTIPGAIFSADVPHALQKRREMQSRLLLHPDVNHVRIQDDDGSMYAFDAALIDFNMPISRTRKKSLFKIELEAPNSAIFDDAAGAALSSTINQVIPGGFQFTATSPQFGTTFYFSAGSDATTITNTSEIPSFPVITILGKTTNPVFTNRVTNASLSFQNYAVGADSATVIDFAERTVLLGLQSDIDPDTGLFLPGKGGNAFAYVHQDSDWWQLVPGDNLISFTSGGGGDASSAMISWRPGYWGI